MLKNRVQKLISIIPALIFTEIIGSCFAFGVQNAFPINNVYETSQPRDNLSGNCGDDCSWSFDPSTGNLEVSGTGINDYQYVHEVPWYSFRNSIKSLNLSYGLKTLGSYAFWGCYELTSVVIPDSVTRIGDIAFHSCSALTFVSIPESVTSIGNWAFSSCSALTSVTIRGSLTSIGKWVFQSCRALSHFHYLGTSDPDISDTNKVFLYSPLANVTVPANYNDTSFCGKPISNTEVSCGGNCSWTLNATELIISGTGNMNDYNETNPPWYSFRETIQSIKIIDGLEIIGALAFEGCVALTSVTIPDSVTHINFAAFGYCKNLVSVDIPNSVTFIGQCVFQGCISLSSVNISNNLSIMPAGIFSHDVNLNSITIPSSITSIEDDAFAGCSNLSRVNYLGRKNPGSNNSNGFVLGAFRGCNSLYFINVPDDYEGDLFCGIRIPTEKKLVVVIDMNERVKIDDVIINQSIHNWCQESGVPEEAITAVEVKTDENNNVISILVYVDDEKAANTLAKKVNDEKQKC